jgi:epoxyqueuosine reductase
MKEKIRQRALELGFDDCRFTTAAAPASAGQFKNWLAEKQHGEMAWLERTAAKRLDPQQVLNGAKSVICLAASYGSHLSNSLIEAQPDTAAIFSPSPPPKEERGGVRSPIIQAQIPSPQPSPRSGGERESASAPSCGPLISRYARFDDYHDVLGDRLKELIQFVNQLGGAETGSLWYVDTGPVLERDFAQRAGLGFVGKHTNVISRRFGNWILLAEIVTSLELEPDAPEKNHCGNCMRCIEACPTRAIAAPFQLDARLCISYLTIELKGSIPVELRPAIGNRIFGCDDCLAVCPWNRFAREGRLMKEHARSDLAAPDLIELLQLDEAGFKVRFAGTPILRTKHRGLLRNICVALGNIGDASALPHLQKAAKDSEPLIVEHAQWAVERIQSKKQF